ncbi:hypothetical protein Sa4125_02280 [Aureimonas sp. SA4125]|uniref:hypothetical protein n=1 Tax=Aureimonas sp. SA4125 TaxID=2826993 RepID=UPI001CC6FF3D|nr:hypothetical protein [Aureimonas sp. SA4125]BDA82686.1 hypothetical protein Sa4125_02280 [Aureimonas sp. SA4125]
MTPSSPVGSPPTPDATPTLDEVLRYFTGAAELMLGRAEGLRRLDLSADGFWRSFFAIPVALPPMALSWVQFERLPRPVALLVPSPALAYSAHALADFLAWILPVVVLMLVARPIGYSRKIVPLVVATNWGGALIAWALVPYWLIGLMAGDGEIMAGLGLVAGLGSIALTIRLTSSALGRDILAAVAIVLLMLVLSLFACRP